MRKLKSRSTRWRHGVTATLLGLVIITALVRVIGLPFLITQLNNSGTSRDLTVRGMGESSAPQNGTSAVHFTIVNRTSNEARLLSVSANDFKSATPNTVTAQTSDPVARPLAARMSGFTYVRQGWNNCGPANVTMALSHFGWQESQEFAADALKPNPEDKNVSPAEMVSFVRDQSQVLAITRVGGDLELLKTFIAANIAVIVETGYSLEGEDWLGHYQTLVGYDDNEGVFYIYDSWLGNGDDGAGLTEAYSDFDTNWQAFNRTFVVLYERDREPLVQQILGERSDVTRANELALVVARDEARANPQNGFAWFNLGTSYTKLGQYEQAAAAYDRASQLGLPFRMLWYQFGPFEAYFETGRYNDVLALVNTNIATAGSNVEETFYWQGKVFAAQGRTQEAVVAFQQAITQNPNFEPAREASNALSS